MDLYHFLRLSLSQAMLLLDRTTNLRLIRKPTGSKYVVLINLDFTGQVPNSLPRPIKSSIHHCIALEWRIWFLTWEGMSLLKYNQLQIKGLVQIFLWMFGIFCTINIQKCFETYNKQDKVNNADSAFIFLIIQSQNQWSGWSGRRRWTCLVWSLLER